MWSDKLASGKTKRARFWEKEHGQYTGGSHPVRGAPVRWRKQGEKEDSVVVKTAIVEDSIAAILYLIEDAFFAAMRQVRDAGKPHSNSCMDMRLYSMFEKLVSAKFESVTFRIFLWLTLEDTLSSPRYLVEAMEERLRTDKMLRPLDLVVKSGTDSVMHVSLKPIKQIISFAVVTEKTVAARLSGCSGPLPTDISDNRTNTKAYSVMDFDEEELHRRENKRSRSTLKRKTKIDGTEIRL